MSDDAPATVAFLPDGTELTLGLNPGIPSDLYHALDGASFSRLKIMRERTPAHLHHAMQPDPDCDCRYHRETKALVIGAAVHDAVLLPEVFGDRWATAGRCEAVTQKGTQCSKTGVARFDGHWFCGIEAHQPPEEPDDLRALSADDYAMCLAMRDSVAEHRVARQLIEGDAEMSALWRDPETEQLCRARFDLVGFRTGTIVDLKTAYSAQTEDFARSVFDQAYHLQAAFYLDGARVIGMDHDRFVFIVAEKEPPYEIACFQLKHEAIEDGERELRPLLQLYAECVALDSWPGYTDLAITKGFSAGVESLDLPYWGPRAIDRKLGEAT